jgi:tRNA-Thr(GGU) m(6)t(6)A37 methyltransferase TsaA
MVIDPESVRLRSIGIVRSPYKQPSGAPIQGAFAPKGEGTIEIYGEFTDGLADLEGFSHIWLIYLFHLSQGYKLRVVPFMDDVERGLFATRAPRRPNPLGLSLVRLLRAEGSLLHIAEIDLVDGTPVLDIKPFSPEIDSRSEIRCGWLERIDKETRHRRSRADRRFCGQDE